MARNTIVLERQTKMFHLDILKIKYLLFLMENFVKVIFLHWTKYFCETKLIF